MYMYNITIKTMQMMTAMNKKPSCR